MRTWIKVILALAVVGIIALFLVYKFVYNKPHPDFEKKKADYSITASELFTSYRDDNASASKKFNGKVLEVSGILDDIETVNGLSIAVFVFDEGMFGDEGVRITMLPEHSKMLNNYVPGQEITIKGFCTGYNETDVIIEKGSIVN